MIIQYSIFFYKLLKKDKFKILIFFKASNQLSRNQIKRQQKDCKNEQGIN